MKKLFSALAMIAITVFSLAGCSDKSAGTDSAGKGKSTDYSRKDSLTGSKMFRNHLKEFLFQNWKHIRL